MIFTSCQKTAKSSVPVAGLDMLAGSCGITFELPTDKIQSGDLQPIQTLSEPGQMHQSLQSTTWPAWGGDPAGGCARREQWRF